VRTGYRTAAEVLHGRLLPFRDHLVTTHVTVDPVVCHTLGRLERLLGLRDDADESFRRAHRLHTNLRCPAFVSLTEAEWAHLLVDRNRGGDVGRARAMATRAHETAAEYGYLEAERAASAALNRLN
jgi:hypothetical protein